MLRRINLGTVETDRIRRAYEGYAEAHHPGLDSQNAGNRGMLRERQRATARLLGALGELPLRKQRILDVGCGVGFHLASLEALGAPREHLFGFDLLDDRLTTASCSYPGIQFTAGNAENLPYPDGSFDLVFVGMLFSSILSDEMAFRVARAVDRVLRPGGLIIWYDFRFDNPRNPQVRGMPLRQVQRLFPSFQVRLQKITLFPPLSRRLGRLTVWIYPLLARIPLLQTHYLGVIRKPFAG